MIPEEIYLREHFGKTIDIFGHTYTYGLFVTTTFKTKLYKYNLKVDGIVLQKMIEDIHHSKPTT